MLRGVDYATGDALRYRASHSQAKTATDLLEIISPVRTDGLLPPHVPDVELVALVLERLDVETKGRLDGVDIVPVELLDNGGLAGVVESPVGKKEAEAEGEVEQNPAKKGEYIAITMLKRAP